MKLSSLREIVSALNRRDVRFLIAGGLAVAAHGYGRVTFDLDIVLQLEPENVHRAVSALESLGYRPVAPVSAHELAEPAKREAWIRDKNMVVFSLRSEQYRETPVDIFVAEPFVFDTEYDRALIGDILPGVPARFICLETLIRMKEQTGREKDREDVRQLKFFLEKPDEQA
ncbi:MAG TPA: hypothetical protein VFG71_01235 [Nitrospiraceae bacterium]|nr:hypothetical protein [Nitrospiraceae bacterium]